MKKRLRGKCFVACLLAAFALTGCDNGNDSVTGGSLALTCAASPASGTAPLQVGFTAVTSGTTSSVSVAINFGDGTTAVGTTVGHTYGIPGSYTARFTATSSGGASAECSTGVKVSAPPAGPAGPLGNQPPDAIFKTDPPDASGTISGQAPLDVNFNMCPTVDPDHDPLYFTMDFQLDGSLDVQGTTGAACRSGSTYSAGSFQARVCVTDIDGGGGALHPAQCRIYSIEATP